MDIKKINYSEEITEKWQQKIYSVVWYDIQENCFYATKSFTNLENAKHYAILNCISMICDCWENDLRYELTYEKLQNKWDMDDPCIARDFTDENWLYCFDWENIWRVEILQNELVSKDFTF